MNAVKQSEQILDALEYGCETTREIMAYTSLRRGVCAAWLSKLRADGWVAVVGSTNFGGRGRQGYRWRLKRIDEKGAA